MKQLVNIICPMFGLSCRHCSEEYSYNPYTEIKRDPITKIFIPVKTGMKKTPLGLWCNDAGAWVNEMQYCTVIWGNANVRERKPEKKKVKKRTTPIVKPVKKHTLEKSRIARSVKASISKLSKKNTTVKKERGVKGGTIKKTKLPDIIQL
jgi:hypothetical protein